MSRSSRIKGSKSGRVEVMMERSERRKKDQREWGDEVM